MINESTVEVSLITIGNIQKVYDEFVENLKTQVGVNYELITISNYDNHLSGSRTSYNTAAKKAKGKYLIFLHPDIRFLDHNSLKDITNEVKDLEKKHMDLGVVGIAGCQQLSASDKRIILSSMIHGNEKVPAGTEIAEPVEVQTVDECLIIVERNTFLKNPFPESTGFHLYAVDLCLDYLIKGKRNIVVPSNVWHMSDGASLSPDYVLQVKKLVRKYRKFYPVIFTSVRKWKTGVLYETTYINMYYIKQVIKKRLMSVTS